MTPPAIPELDKKIEHFQNINAGIVSTIVTTLLTLSVGLIAYGVNIVVNATKPLDCAPKWWMIASYRDQRTRDFAAGRRVKAFSGIERPARLKLDRLESATATEQA